MFRSKTMRISKSNYNLNKRTRKLKDGEESSLMNERISTQKITYASQSEIDESIKFLLKKYADTFRRLAE